MKLRQLIFITKVLMRIAITVGVYFLFCEIIKAIYS